MGIQPFVLGPIGNQYLWQGLPHACSFYGIVVNENHRV